MHQPAQARSSEGRRTAPRVRGSTKTSEAPPFQVVAAFLTTTMTTTALVYETVTPDFPHAHSPRNVKPNLSQQKEQVMVTRGKHVGVPAVCFSADSESSIRGRVVGNPLLL